MANPTTYFGWVMPTSSSLVTNLPADFNTFGQAVDTSMSELLGGTTGQVLSKTSNTSMDFTWVTPTDQTPLTTKGDLFTFTTVDARLGVGTNGQTLTADSTAATGLAWTTPSSGFTYTTWTPTFAGTTVGNGTLTARYAQSGKMVHAYMKLVFGSTTLVTGNTTVSLPVTGSSNATGTRGTGAILDSGVRWYTAAADMNGTTQVTMVAVNASSTNAYEDYLSATVPMTWTTGDTMQFSIIYEAA